MKAFVHDPVSLHNTKQAKKIVDWVMEIYKPTTVVDVGCGLGNFLNAFKDNGVSEILGLNGNWVEKDLLFQNISPDEFLETDLENPSSLGRKFDLAVCLEVAEHIPEKYAKSLVKFLVESGNVILFSAAIPEQKGDNHVNEQWPSYWAELFESQGFVFQDVLRPLIWNDSEISYWYRQNIFFVTPKDFSFDPKWKSNQIQDLVHYQLFLNKTELLESILNGKEKKGLYLKLLIKSFLGGKTSKKIKKLLG